MLQLRLKHLGRAGEEVPNYACSPAWVSPETYSASSQLAPLHVKYVCDWLNPIFARSRIASEINNPISAAARILEVFTEIWAITVIATLSAALRNFLQAGRQKMWHER